MQFIYDDGFFLFALTFAQVALSSFQPSKLSHSLFFFFFFFLFSFFFFLFFNFPFAQIALFGFFNLSSFSFSFCFCFLFFFFLVKPRKGNNIIYNHFRRGAFKLPTQTWYFFNSSMLVGSMKGFASKSINLTGPLEYICLIMYGPA